MNTVDKAEIENFEKIADSWWDANGPFKPLHKLGPTRIQYIRDQITQHYGLDKDSLTPFKGLNILDIGCGGGLVCEPMARLGANMTGVDASEKNINVAITHANKMELDIEYLPMAAEDLVQKDKRYDAVLALEIIEHTSDPALFIELCTKLLKPEGVIIFSTLNRTAKSFALGIVAAEYIMRWLPRGTHDWKKFLKPSEIAAPLRKLDFDTTDVTGLVYNPVSGKFSLSSEDTAVNYFLAASHNK